MLQQTPIRQKKSMETVSFIIGVHSKWPDCHAESCMPLKWVVKGLPGWIVSNHSSYIPSFCLTVLGKTIIKLELHWLLQLLSFERCKCWHLFGRRMLYYNIVVYSISYIAGTTSPCQCLLEGTIQCLNFKAISCHIHGYFSKNLDEIPIGAEIQC